MFLVVALQERDSRVQKPAGKFIVLQNIDEAVQSIVLAVMDAGIIAVLKGERSLPKSAPEILNIQEGHRDAERYIACGYLSHNEAEQAVQVFFADQDDSLPLRPGLEDNA